MGRNGMAVRTNKDAVPKHKIKAHGIHINDPVKVSSQLSKDNFVATVSKSTSQLPSYTTPSSKHSKFCLHFVQPAHNKVWP